MPGLVILGRRWRLGSDDLVCPAIVSAIVKVIWISVMFAYLVHVELVFSRRHRKCRGSQNLVSGVLLCILLLGLTTITLLFWLGHKSSRGTILATGARSAVPGLVMATFLMLIFEGIASIVLAYTAWAPKGATVCTRLLRGPDFEKFALRSMSVFQMCAVAISVLVAVLLFDPSGSMRVKTADFLRAGNRLEVRVLADDAGRSWLAECAFLCCCAYRCSCGIFGGREIERQRSSLSNPSSENESTAVRDIALLLAHFMGNLDVVLTDVAAGLALVRVSQRAEQTQLLTLPTVTTHDQNDDTIGVKAIACFNCAVDPKAQFLRTENHVLKEAKYLMEFALAAYGWKLLFVMSPLTALRLLCVHVMRRILGCLTCFLYFKSGYTCCDSLDARAMSYVARANEYGPRRLRFTSFLAEVNRLIPAAIYLDIEKRKVIVACRGTLSLEDLLTDASAKPVRLADNIPPTLHFSPETADSLVHSGMLAVALELYSLLIAPVKEAIDSFDTENPPELLVTGHSLGGGVAALLALLFHSAGLEARCFSFSPPGALVDQSLSQSMRPYCNSFIVGDDLVARLGLKPLHELRDNVIRAVSNASCHKRQAISSFFATSPKPNEFFLSAEAPLKPEADALAEACISHLATDQTLLANITPPGRIFHIVTTVNQVRKQHVSICASFAKALRCLLPCGLRSSSRLNDDPASKKHSACCDCCCSCCLCFCDHRHRHSRVAALATESTFFCTIRITRRMFLDHMPWVVREAVVKAADDAPFVITEVQQLLLEETEVISTSQLTSTLPLPPTAETNNTKASVPAADATVLATSVVVPTENSTSSQSSPLFNAAVTRLPGESLSRV